MDQIFSYGTPIGTLWGVVVTLLLLFVFGIGYNAFVTRLGIDAEGYVWLLVVGGVLVTIGGIAILDVFLAWNAGLLSLLAFSASGLPMCAGGVYRYVKSRRRLLDLLRATDDRA